VLLVVVVVGASKVPGHACTSEMDVKGAVTRAVDAPDMDEGHVLAIAPDHGLGILGGIAHVLVDVAPHGQDGVAVHHPVAQAHADRVHEPDGGGRHREVAQWLPFAGVAGQLGLLVVALRIDHVDAALLVVAVDLTPDVQLAGGHRLLELLGGPLDRTSPECQWSPSTVTRVGTPSELITRRWSRPAGPGPMRPAPRCRSARSAPRPAAAPPPVLHRDVGAVLRLDRLPVVPEAVRDQREGGGQDRQHRRRGDSSTATVQPAVPASGDPIEPVLGRVAGGRCETFEP
jgi:hypothetical protein